LISSNNLYPPLPGNSVLQNNTLPVVSTIEILTGQLIFLLKSTVKKLEEGLGLMVI
jgi:hypothetical protein